MAPAERHKPRGRARRLAPSIPPKAATGNRASLARRLQPAAPSTPPAGWLEVGNTGDRNARSAPACAARCNSSRLCAELVTSAECCNMRRRGAKRPWRRPARRCTPAPSDAASRGSPAMTSASRRTRQILANSRPSMALPGTPSWRNTTPHSPFGSRDTAARGSGSRTASVNSHNTGIRPAPGTNRRDDLTARAQATSF